MSRALASAALGAALLFGAQPAAAQDMIYRYKPTQLRPLANYNQQPYWAVLSECAGIYGALSNGYEAQGRAPAAQAAKARGVGYLRAAIDRLTTDRRIPAAEARKLTLERVETGRAAGQALLGEPVTGERKREQIADVMCSQVQDAHRSALRFARR